MSVHRKSKCGVTLVELLVVMAIIGILASLLLGTVYKAHVYAKDKTWRIEAYNFCDYIKEHLLQHYQSQTNYPALTAAQLHQQGIFDDQIMDFLSCPHVQFIPFSSSDQDDKIILRIDNYWVFKQTPIPGHINDLILTKKLVTRPE